MSDPTTNEDYWLHIVRNGYGYSDDAKRDARLHLADSFEKYRQQLATEREANKKLAAIGGDLTFKLATTERLLAESQAREKEAIRKMHECADAHVRFIQIDHPQALDAAIAKAKREENEACAKVCAEDESGRDSGGYFAEVIRARLADELKGGEQ